MTLQERLAPGKYRLTVADYLRLDEAGIFGTERTELLDGDIIVMNAEYRPHAWIRDELVYRLRRALEDLPGDLTATGGSVLVSDHDMPIPDITLTREPRGEGPIPLASVALVIEVSSTTLRRDMQDKARIYAKGGIAEYWIVDVDAQSVHQLWQPAGDGYRNHRLTLFGDPVVAVTIDGLAVQTSALRR